MRCDVARSPKEIGTDEEPHMQPTNNKVVLRVISFVAVSAFALSLAGCNTVKGAGKDIQTGAEKTEEAIQGK